MTSQEGIMEIRLENDEIIHSSITFSKNLPSLLLPKVDNFVDSCVEDKMDFLQHDNLSESQEKLIFEECSVEGLARDQTNENIYGDLDNDFQGIIMCI